MGLKEIVDDVREVSTRVILGIPDYLLGYDIHTECVSHRRNIIANVDDVGKRVGTLSLNYAYEGLRQVIRYVPLAIEITSSYGYLNGDPSLADSLLTYSMGIRFFEGSVLISVHNARKEAEVYDNIIESNKSMIESMENLRDILRDFAEQMQWIFETINENPSFRDYFRSDFTGDPYETLGIERDASEQEIKKAYRSIALECHPDSTEEPDKAKTERFIDATKAYDILMKTANPLLEASQAEKQSFSSLSLPTEL